jgi:histidine ammonia-lyase
MAAAQAQDLRGSPRPAPATRAARDAVRELVPFLDSDRGLKPDVDAAVALVGSGALLEAVERVTGPLD